MNKERIIKVAVLSVVFVIAMFVSSVLINRGGADMTAEMGKATLPTISFVFEGKTVNLLVGHKQEMNTVAIRDSIVTYNQGLELSMQIHHNENKVKSLTYEILSLDEKELFYKKSTEKISDKIVLEMNGTLGENQEGLLKLTLNCADGPVYYYTRIIKDQSYYTKECLEYVLGLHRNILNKQNEDAIKKVMEPNEQGNNSTLQHVTIHSNLSHVMWGDLEPKYVVEPQIEIKETKKAYTSIQLRYQVQCRGNNNEREVYEVTEYFKVAYGPQRIYLLEYDRTMEEIFDTSNVVLSSKGVLLGVAKETLSYKTNSKGTIVAFVQAQELWHYNKEKDAFALVFSFGAVDREDERNRTNQHSIKILSMEEDGDVTFAVCGYMNRGVHEGESGVAVYFYDMSQNTIREELFIPSQESLVAIEKDLSQSIYYHREKDVLYTLVDGRLLKIASKQKKPTVLVEGLDKVQYVASKDGRRFAYQKTSGTDIVTEVWDFLSEKKWVVSAQKGETVIPIGFIGSDFVYGVSRKENAGFDAAGNEIWAMHRLEIRDASDTVVKTYSKEGVFILYADIGNNMITLKQGKKNQAVYTVTEEDYITSNYKENTYITLQSYWTDLKETQYRITFSTGIQDKKAKTLRPKHILQEKPLVLSRGEGKKRLYYYVYVNGKQVEAFEDAGDAVNLARQRSGVVISPQYHYVWETNNQEAWYHNFGVSKFSTKSGENTLQACIRKVLWYEGKNVDVLTEMQTKSAEQILRENLSTEVIRFAGCSVKDMRYLIDKGIPVIAMKNQTSAILLIGYDASGVTYIDPANGGQYMSSFERIDSMTAGSGNTFIAYVK